MSGDEWRDEAKCTSVNPEIFFIESASAAARAKSVCRRCDVKAQCLADALRDEGNIGPGSRFGIFGEKDPQERAEIARRATRRKSA